MSVPLISIIIPTYNRAHILCNTISSVLSQSFNNWECIIVDDGSTDNTEHVVATFSKKNSSIKYYKRPEELIKGPNSCRNFGFSKSKGTIINWFDSDDLYLPNALQNIANQFNNQIDAVVAKLEVIDLSTKTKIKENKIISNNIVEDYFTGKIAYYVCGPFWNRSFLEKQKTLFDENISNLDDWDFNMRMILQNPKIIYFNQPIIQYQFHENSLSQEIHKLNFNEIISEFKARDKILKLLQKKNILNLFIINKFYISRCQFFLKEALLQKHPKKYYLLIKTVSLQIKNFKFLNVLKTIFGFIFFIIFKKGYKLIKP